VKQKLKGGGCTADTTKDIHRMHLRPNRCCDGQTNKGSVNGKIDNKWLWRSVGRHKPKTSKKQKADDVKKRTQKENQAPCT